MTFATGALRERRRVAFIEFSRQRPNVRNRVSAEGAVVELAIEQPASTQLKVADALAEHDLRISAAGLAEEAHLIAMKPCLNALQAKMLWLLQHF